MILVRFKKAILLNRIAKLKLATTSEIESILRKHVFPQRAGRVFSCFNVVCSVIEEGAGPNAIMEHHLREESTELSG